MNTFFIGKNETEMDSFLDPKSMMSVYPEIYGPRFDAIAELRKLDDGSLHKGSGFRRVASFVNIPLFKAASTVLDPEFMSDKRRFYAFLRRNKEYATYDIKSHAQNPRYTSTVVDGKVI